ncbi:MAG: sulfur carrier protein ThiS [Bacteroidia bacterium]|nr:sulfur carrier protein ThiS [Bacteroidia bacterium]
MRITLNNRVEELKGDRLTISELLKVMNFTFKMLIIKINGKLIDKFQYDSAEIVEGDDVQVLHLISGG